MELQVNVKVEKFPLLKRFEISRGIKRTATVVFVELSDGINVGRGECGPNLRYNESPESVVKQIADLSGEMTSGLDRFELQKILPPGAARNGLDSAFWDLESKRKRKRVWELAGFDKPSPLNTAFTLSIGSPESMELEASSNASLPLLKLKLNGVRDIECVRAVKKGAPRSRIIVDANEAWTADMFVELSTELSTMGVELVEQPLPSEEDDFLATVSHPIPVCADESCIDSSSLKKLKGKYEMVNIKLDKAGGLTEAIQMLTMAEILDFEVMVGCMLGTSLSVAPAFTIGQKAKFVDLDGPMLLREDREPGLKIIGNKIYPPTRNLWG